MTSLLVSLTLAVTAPVPKDDKADREFREKVDFARLKAVRFLREKQNENGSWDGLTPGQVTILKGGETALVVLALLEAGVPANDPAVAKAVAFLLPLKPERTYVVSLRLQVLAHVDAKKYAKEIQADADWLLDTAIVKDKKLQGWSYPGNTIGDNSNTHFAVMGLHAAAQAGAKVDPEIWKKVREYFAATQRPNGGWTYLNTGDSQTTRSMTTAALLALAVAVKYDKQAKGPDPAFEDGMAALLDGKLGPGKVAAYDLFTTAELGRALGSTEFKTGKLAKAWYREGVEELLGSQDQRGAWTSDRGIYQKMPVFGTACGLFFLGPPKK